MSYAGSAEVLLIEARRKFRANSVRTELAEGLRLTDEGRMVASTRDKASGSSAGGASDGPQRLLLGPGYRGPVARGEANQIFAGHVAIVRGPQRFGPQTSPTAG
jgi:hypothetical protein